VYAPVVVARTHHLVHPCCCVPYGMVSGVEAGQILGAVEAGVVVGTKQCNDRGSAVRVHADR
jgi:hypothetical protein